MGGGAYFSGGVIFERDYREYKHGNLTDANFCCVDTFALFRVPSNFSGNLLIELHAEGLESRVEPSVLQQLGQVA